MTQDIPESLSLVFIPSPQDIIDYQGDDGYRCGLREVELEIQCLVDEIAHAFYKCPTIEEKKQFPAISKFELTDGETFHYVPDLLFQLGLVVTSGTVSTLVYKLISKWIDYKNGRKLHVRLPSGFEVDATHLSQEQFIHLFQLLYEKYGSGRSEQPLSRSELQSAGLTPVNEHKTQILKALRDTYDKKREEIALREEKNHNPPSPAGC
jgi:hypothetical protein